MKLSRPALVALALAVTAIGAGCADADSTVGRRAVTGIPPVPTSTIPPTTTTTKPCEDPPVPAVTDAEIAAERARLARDGITIGVDENTEGLGNLDPETGHLSGFEVALAEEIGLRLTGDPAKVELRNVVPGNKVDVVTDGRADATVSSVSMSCGRRQKVLFSREYFTAYHELLVPTGSEITGAEGLAGKRVCVTAGSSSVKLLAEVAPAARKVEVPTRAECLVELQRGRADAYLGHDTFLWGLNDQDAANTRILDTQLETQHYGIAIAPDRPALQVLVNEVLVDLCAEGGLQQMADENPLRGRAVVCDGGLPR